jgi:hypothetical protein
MLIRNLAMFAYVLASGAGLPYLIQGRNLIGRFDASAMDEISAVSLLTDYIIVSAAIVLLFTLCRALTHLSPRLRRDGNPRQKLNMVGVALTGSACFANSLMLHHDLFGSTWAPGEAFREFVQPYWLVVLLVLIAGGSIGGRLKSGRS